ncbi:MAG: NAD-dependent epimerase/dehydratase family protein [Reyranellaceae bacterium]
MAVKGRILVTGGSGYIATFCIARLLDEGFAVRATVRAASRGAEVRRTVAAVRGCDAEIEIAAADLTADAGWAAAAADCDGVLHVASPLPSQNPKNDGDLVGPARDGALRVLTAARDAGARRVVMTSSTAAVAYGHGGRTAPGTEADWSDAGNRADTSAYERSKTLAERAAWDWLAREGGSLELVTVCPGAVLGPVAGRDFSASIDIVRKLLDGSLPGLPRMGWPLVDVRDIADLHLRALTTQGVAGRRFIGAGRFFWMADIAGVLRAEVPELARRVPRRVLPDWLLRIAALVDPVVRDRLFELGKPRPVSSDAARRDLGWTQRPYEETIRDTARSLLAQGLVKAA